MPILVAVTFASIVLLFVPHAEEGFAALLCLLGGLLLCLLLCLLVRRLLGVGEENQEK